MTVLVGATWVGWELCVRFWPDGQNDGLGSGNDGWGLAPADCSEPLFEG